MRMNPEGEDMTSVAMRPWMLLLELENPSPRGHTVQAPSCSEHKAAARRVQFYLNLGPHHDVRCSSLITGYSFMLQAADWGRDRGSLAIWTAVQP